MGGGERGFGCRPIEDVIAGLRLIKGEWNVLLPKLDALQLMGHDMDRLLREFGHKNSRTRVIGGDTAVGQPDACAFVEFPVCGLNATDPLSGGITLLAFGSAIPVFWI